MSKKILIKVIIFCFILFSILENVSAQNNIIINGNIVDAETQLPLSFANIYVSSERFATISNLQGDFELKIDTLALRDSLYISFMGYKTHNVPVNEVFKDTLFVKLQYDIYQIREITITPDFAVSVLKKVVEKIPENSFNESLKLQAFYREIIEENGLQVQYAEAVFDIYKIRKNRKYQNRIDLIKGRIKVDEKKSYLWSLIDFVDGPYELVKADVTANMNQFIVVPQNKINFLKENHFKYYNYTISQSYKSNGNDDWIIQFEPKKQNNKGAYSGQIFIDPDSYAIKSIEYEIDDTKLDNVKLIPFRTQMFLEDMEVENHTLDYFCVIRYKCYQGRWILNSARMDYQIVFNSQQQHIFSAIRNVSELVITQIDSITSEKVRYKNALQLRRSLLDQIGVEDSTFWKDYNIIKHEKRDF